MENLAGKLVNLASLHIIAKIITNTADNRTLPQSPVHEQSTAQSLLHRSEDRLGTRPVGWDCTRRLAAAGPGLLGVASGRAPPCRCCAQGSP